MKVKQHPGTLLSLQPACGVFLVRDTEVPIPARVLRTSPLTMKDKKKEEDRDRDIVWAGVQRDGIPEEIDFLVVFFFRN